MGKAKMTVYVDGEKTRETKNEKEIYTNLAYDLLHKKLHKCQYIYRITDKTNYDGTRTVKVYITNGVKRVYLITDC